jgi:hypothetical protein
MRVQSVGIIPMCPAPFPGPNLDFTLDPFRLSDWISVGGLFADSLWRARAHCGASRTWR